MKRSGVCNGGEGDTQRERERERERVWEDMEREKERGIGGGGERVRESNIEKSCREGVGFLLVFLCVSPTEVSVLLCGLGTTLSSASCPILYMYMCSMSRP
jgi:hypothetical protein